VGRVEGQLRRAQATAVTTHAIDALFKLAGRQLLDAVRQRYGLSLAPIARELPTELPRMALDLKRLDLLYLLADGTAVDLECQRRVLRKDIRRFATYGLRLLDDEQLIRRVLVVVLCGPKPGRLPLSGDLGLGIPLRMLFVRLVEEPAEVVLARLQAVAAQGTWTERDRLDLLFLPLMPHAMPMESVVRAGLEVAQRLPADWQDQAIGGLLSLAYHAMSEAGFDRLVTMMSGTKLLDKLFHEALEKGREEGLERGREEGLEKGREGQRAMVREVIEQRFGTVPPALEARITAADGETLRALLQRALVAHAVEDLAAG